MIRIAQETPDDSWDIEYLLDTAFAPGRSALSSYRLREGVSPVTDLCMVARDDDEIAALAACIRYWPVQIGEAAHPALLLGPIATHPTRQGEGIGAMLMLQSMERAAVLGWERVILVGDEPYYSRFGFSRKAALALEFPQPTNPNRILAKALVAGGMDGVAGAVARWNTATA